MVFSSPIFLFYFLPTVLAVYYALPWLIRGGGANAAAVTHAKNLWLLAVSYVFYGWWSPWFVFLMLFVTTVNYVCGMALERFRDHARARLGAVSAAVALSLGTLGFFKYVVFAQRNLNMVLGWFDLAGFPVLEVVLPVGISFYVFQALSYSVDVYRGTAPAARSWADFACYVALFPQLVAGPIVRYHTVAKQLVEREHRWDRFASGVALFIIGLCKKLLLANPLGTVADAAFGARSLTCLDAWWGVTAYAFQIYFDFAGYSDMAVGLGRMVGFEFLQNFNAPYRAESITDFWRRWHISLSTFLRDYLYIPLGGNRRGPGRTYLNLAVVMLLGGLWHGANWTFVAWGAFHGAMLAAERWRGKRSLYGPLPRPLRVGLTFGLVLISWVLFRCETLAEAGSYLGVMFGGGHAGGLPGALLAAELYGPGQWLLMLVGAWLAFRSLQAHDWVTRLDWFKGLLLAIGLACSVAAMFTQAFNPFLYFQF